jgi:hypothetical protein
MTFKPRFIQGRTPYQEVFSGGRLVRFQSDSINQESVMSEEKKVVHELKLSKPVLFLLWFVALGMVGKPVGNMLIPEAMALVDGDRYSKIYLDINHGGRISE